MTYPQLFLWALAATVTIEAAVTASLKFFFGKWFRLKAGYLELVAITIFASFLTLPYIWFYFPEFLNNRTSFTIATELFAWLVESIFYFLVLKLSFTKSLLFSLTANTFSFILGLFLF